MTLPKIMLGVLIGGGAMASILHDEMQWRDEELRSLSRNTAPLKVECPTGTVKVATQVQGGNWNVRCAGRGKVRAM